MTSSILDQFVNRSRQLYSLPAVAMQVVELTSQPTIDVKSLKECIEHDPALTTKILRVVNSSLFGLSRQVTDLSQALALLGTKPLKLLVLGFSLPKDLLTGIESAVLQRYWRRTVIKAVAARELAETVWRIPGDDAFMAGLLQDMGTLVLIQDLGDSYLKFLDRIHNDGGDLLALETTTLGFDHASLSARLLERWGLPASIVYNVSRPPDTETLVDPAEGKQVVPQILHLSDMVAEFLIRGRPAVLSQLIDLGTRYGDVSLEALETLIAALELKVPQLAEVLSLRLPNDTAYSTILAQAHAQLCDAAESASHDLLCDRRSEADEEAGDFDNLLEQTRAVRREIGQFTGSPSEDRPSSNLFPGDVMRLQNAVVNEQGCSGTAMMLHQVTAPKLLGQIEAAVKSCRQARRAVSLALLEMDQADGVKMQIGAAQFHRTMNQLQITMNAVVDHEVQFMQVDDGRWALVLEGFDRQPAVELTRRLVRCAREWSAEQPTTRAHALSLSAGVATLAMPPQNFPCRELLDAAERCLSGAQLSGGDTVKSIDI